MPLLDKFNRLGVISEESARRAAAAWKKANAEQRTSDQIAINTQNNSPLETSEFDAIEQALRASS